MYSSHLPEYRIESPAWLLLGVHAATGQLCLQGRNLSFSVDDAGSVPPVKLRKLDAIAKSAHFSHEVLEGRKAVLFSEWLDDVRVSSRWLWFRDGLIVRTVAQRWRFVLRPPRALADRRVDTPSPAGLGRGLREYWLIAMNTRA